MDRIIISSLTQLAGQLPVLLVYLVGLILALVFWKRCPAAGRLTIVAVGLLLLTTLVYPFVFQYLTYARVEQGWEIMTFSRILFVISLANNLIHAAGIGLLLAPVVFPR